MTVAVGVGMYALHLCVRYAPISIDIIPPIAHPNCEEFRRAQALAEPG